MDTIKELAGHASTYFVEATRADRKKFTKLKAGSPKWLGLMVREAHGDTLPDDFKHKAISSILYAMSGYDDPAEASHEICDGLVDVYNHALTAWLASSGDRATYVEEAVREFGGVAKDFDLFKALAMGQYQELSEIYSSVLGSLEKRLEEEA